MTTAIRRGNLIDFLSYATSIDLDKRIRDSQRHIKRLNLASSAPPAPKNVTVSPLPASPVGSELEVDFLPKTDTQRRTRRIVQPRATPRRGVLPGEILAYLRKHGQATNRELAQGLGREHSSIKDATKRMAARGELQEIRFGKQGLLYKKGG